MEREWEIPNGLELMRSQRFSWKTHGPFQALPKPVHRNEHRPVVHRTEHRIVQQQEIQLEPNQPLNRV